MPSERDTIGRGSGASTGGGSPPNSLLDAALTYAARGWPVFPCSPKHKRPLLPADVDAAGKKIKSSGGLSKASTDPAQIRTWWKKWPSALIGLCTGHPTIDANGLRLFVVDFDPRVDEKTGEVWTLDRLKGETEAQIGCALPISLTALSPSDGVHLYLLQDDDGPPVNNRGNLPLHVDVRGLGGYVIAPPSVMAKDAIKGQGGLKYRWHRKEPIGGIAKAPPELIAELRAPKRKPPKVGSTNDLAADQAAASSPSPAPRLSTGDAEEDAVRNYALHALEEECRLLAATPLGNRDNQSNASGFVIGQLVGAGALSRSEAEAALVAAVQGFGDPEARAQAVANGLDAGEAKPRDLSAVRENARDRAARSGHRGDWSAGGAPGRPRAPAPPRWDQQASATPFRDGRDADPVGGGGSEEDHAAPSAAELARMKAVAARWLERRLDHVERTKKALAALAWGIGRRVAGGLVDEGEAKEAIWPKCEDVADIQHADIDKAIADGIARGFDFGPLRRMFKCAGYALTDLGNAERFRDRYGRDFRFTVAKGWLGWDGRRWKVLDQDEKTLPAEIQAAVFDTVRQIQNEGRAVEATGYKDKDENPHGLDALWWISKTKTETKAGLLKKWGLTSESAGKIGCIANLARRWLTVSIEAFDCDPLSINVLNGTLRFSRETMADGSRKASFVRDAHRREDLNTRLAPVEFDAKAQSPRYDALLAWAQPDPAVRRYLHQWGGYSASGLVGEQKLHFWYGLGGNGKSSIIDLWCHVLGDYADTIGIESFMDQGIKKRGDQATPDLAKLGGVRLLRTSEPERGAKLNSALIKAVTGGEPMSVRALHRGFFNLRPLFKLTISGNHKPDIPDTDQGIWRRVRLIAWEMDIDNPPPDAVDWPVKDEQLTDKLKVAEPNGIFRHLVHGLADYLAAGLDEPEAVRASTQVYREASDPLARFMKLCTIPKAGASIQSSKLHKVFEAWARAAGETEWKQKGFSQAMLSKGYKKKASDGMHWLDVELVREVEDFIDDEGKVLDTLPDFERENAAIADAAAEKAGCAPAPPHAAGSHAPPEPSRPLSQADYDNEDP